MAEQNSGRQARRRRSRRRRTVAVAAGLVVVAGGSAVGVAATNGSGPSLRIATVAKESVTQTVESSGTITSSLTLTPAFSESGTVKAVAVAVGDSVHRGQTLARLDTTALQAAVDSANSTVAAAREKLQADETGQTSTGATGASTGASTIAYVVQLAATAPSSTSLSALVAQIQQSQVAVVAAQQHLDTGQRAVDAAQQTVDADITQNTSLSTAQHASCDTSTSLSPTPTESSSSSSANPAADCSTAMADYEAFAATLATDVATLDATITAQDGYTKDLQQAIAKLDVLLGQLKSASAGAGSASVGSGQPGGGAPSSPTSGTRPSGSGPTSSPGNGSANSAPAGGSSSQTGGAQTAQPASAAQLAADQANIDAAQGQVTVAKQNLAAATLQSPAAGKVAAVGMTAGDSSSGQTITIVGTGVQGVDVTVPLAEVDRVKRGQRVSVSADGRSSVLHGTVESIGVLSSTSGSTTTFPVIIQLDAASPQLYDGTGAEVVITTGTATNVITVPNSAIHTGPDGTHTVTVVRSGATSYVAVTLGVAGSDATQIKSGLEAGQHVVLADLGQPLPAATTSTAGTFRPGQFTSAGGFGGAAGARGSGG